MYESNTARTERVKKDREREAQRLAEIKELKIKERESIRKKLKEHKIDERCLGRAVDCIFSGARLSEKEREALSRYENVQIDLGFKTYSFREIINYWRC